MLPTESRAFAARSAGPGRLFLRKRGTPRTTHPFERAIAALISRGYEEVALPRDLDGREIRAFLLTIEGAISIAHRFDFTIGTDTRLITVVNPKKLNAMSLGLRVASKAFRDREQKLGRRTHFGLPKMATRLRGLTRRYARVIEEISIPDLTSNFNSVPFGRAFRLDINNYSDKDFSKKREAYLSFITAYLDAFRIFDRRGDTENRAKKRLRIVPGSKEARQINDLKRRKGFGAGKIATIVFRPGTPKEHAAAKKAVQNYFARLK